MELLLREKSFPRVFVLYSNTGVTAPIFSERSLATSGGRMDVVARCAIYALWDLGSKPRRDTVFIAVLNGPPSPPLALYFYPAAVSLSESAVGLEILKAMRGESSSVSVERAGILELVRRLKDTGYKIVLLIEDGEDIKNIRFSPSEKYAFILGDHIGFPVDVLRELRRNADLEVSIGRTPYLASHCIAFVNDWLDRVHADYEGS